MLAIPTRRALLAAAAPSTDFLATQIANCAFWLAADRQSGYTDTARTTLAVNDGDAIAGGADLSGVGNHVAQATAAKRPTLKLGILNGKPGFLFDGVDDFLSNTSLVATYSQPSTLMVVAKQVALAPGGSNVKLIDGADSTHRYVLQDNNGTPDNYAIAASTALNGGVPNLNPHVLAGIFNGASSSLYVDGTSVASGDAGSQALIGISIGAKFDGTGTVNAYIFEVIVWSRQLSAAELSTAFRGLGRKYAITVA
jgi:hypothetical protein